MAARWGSFISQAVAGVESRLDNMLTEGEEQQQQQPQAQTPMSAAPTAIATSGKSTPSTSNSRSSSKTRSNANDRLQQRLAKAMAAKRATQAGTDSATLASPRSSIDGSSRSSMERLSIDAPSNERNDTTSDPNSPREIKTEATGAIPISKLPTNGQEKESPDSDSRQATASESQTPPQEPNHTATTDSENTNQPEVPIPSSPSITPPDPIDASVIAKELEETRIRHQEETQEYTEKIDSLESKLQYLSRAAAETAKKTASAAPSGSTERKLAEKDEKIALLLEEGQKLSAGEGRLRATIKKLRQQMIEDKEQADELKKGKQKAVSEAEALRNRLNGSEEKEAREREARKATASLQKEVDALKKDKAAKDESMRQLEQDHKTKMDKAEAASNDSHNKAMAAERQKQKSLEETVTKLKVENESLSNSSRMEGVELSEKLERAQERARVMEAEMKNELQAMESKLEAMRAVAEEASSGSVGDGQVKLMRQIETLQSQYASASSNWQGIEASLLTKVTNLEKERDEAQRRESEMRKKARNAGSRCRHLEDEHQEMESTLASARQDLESCREELTSLQTRFKTTESALEQARTDVERERQQRLSAAKEFTDDRERFEEPQSYTSKIAGHPDSPLLPVPRSFSGDLVGSQIPWRSRRGPFSGSIADSADGLSISIGRRLASHSPGRLSTLSPGNSIPPPPFSPFEAPSEMNVRSPSIAPDRDADRDRDHDGNEPTEDRQSVPRNVTHDMISVSTAGAGPSVQLVERMSAAIRRLEAEKVAAREEMARVCSQRDEARSDIVGLMKDVESSKAAASKVTGLEQEISELNARYQTTLELLGEKSEQVEELKADVQDVKAMYRELVERTIK